jgi:hypothetical protein
MLILNFTDAASRTLEGRDSRLVFCRQACRYDLQKMAKCFGKVSEMPGRITSGRWQVVRLGPGDPIYDGCVARVKTYRAEFLSNMTGCV